MKQITNGRMHMLRNKKVYKVGAVTSLALLLAACGNSTGGAVFFATLDPDTFGEAGGSDTISYINSDAGITVRLYDGFTSGDYAVGDDFTNIENVIGSDFNDIIIGDNNDNIISGGDGNDELGGFGGNDIINGGAGNDNINGDWGDDIIEGGAGGDIINGGLGVDTASYANSSALVNINLFNNTYSGGDAEGDTLTNIDNIIGSAFDDDLRGDNDDNVINGGAGNDYLFGRDGNDTLNGGEGDDNIVGAAGDDIIDGGAGIDIARIFDNIGNANIIIDKDNDQITIISGDGTDYITAIESIWFDTGTIDVWTDLWGVLIAAEKDKFTDEADFKDWLFDDTGYNYEGV